MIAVGMVQVAGHQVVHVIAMGNLLMAAGRTVAMGLLMPGTGVLGSAGSRVGGIDLENVVVDVVAMNVMQVAVVQVIRVVAVLDSDMAATRTMLVIVAFMHLAVFLRHAARSSLDEDRSLILSVSILPLGNFIDQPLDRDSAPA
jgi:hypothetical protein